MAIQEQWAELLEPGLRSIFNIQRDALADVSKIPTLFNVSSSSKAEEHDLGVGGMSDWEKYQGTIEYDDLEQGFEKTYEHEEFVKGFKIERRLVDDDQYMIINKRPRALAITAMRKREKDAASVFNHAFNSSYTGGDDTELCGSHSYSPSNSTTQSNAGSDALSYDSVVATRKLMRSFVDDRGELVNVKPDTIVIPSNLEDVAYEELKGELKPGTADNDLSYVSALGFRIIAWDYLDDNNNWFMLDSALAGLYLNWFNRAPIEFAMDPGSDFQLEARFRGYMRYSYGWSDFRFVYGHDVA